MLDNWFYWLHCSSTAQLEPDGQRTARRFKTDFLYLNRATDYDSLPRETLTDVVVFVILVLTGRDVKCIGHSGVSN